MEEVERILEHVCTYFPRLKYLRISRNIIRNMRKKNPSDALFPRIRQKILGATYGQPERWWFMSELADHINTTPSSLQRELSSLIESGILRRRNDCNRLYFKSGKESPSV